MKTTTSPLGIEKELHKRLKFIGCVLLSFAIITIVWDFFPNPQDELDELLLEIEETPPAIHPYLIASTFTLIGSSCLLIYWKKKGSFSNNES